MVAKRRMFPVPGTLCAMLYARFAILVLRLVYFLRTWHPLLALSPWFELPHHPEPVDGSKGVFAACPVEYLLDRKYIGFAVEY